MQYLLFAVGLSVLLIGAEVMVRFSVKLATALGVSTMVIGLTVVAFGTSAPELAVSTIAAAKASPDLALGNVIGSNIANVALVLGFAGLLFPLALPRSALKREVPLMIAVSVLFFALTYSGNGLTRIDGIVLLAAFTVVLFLIIKYGKTGYAEEAAEIAAEGPVCYGTGCKFLYMMFTLLGTAGLVGGAHVMVEAAVKIAEAHNVSSAVIGMTIVAIGTSLPEVAASAAAAIKNEPGLSVGNAVGSNVFNICLVMGIASVIRPVDAAGANNLFTFFFPVMLLAAILLFPIFWGERKTRKWEALLLLTGFVAYLALAAKFG